MSFFSDYQSGSGKVSTKLADEAFPFSKLVQNSSFGLVQNSLFAKKS